MKPRPDLPCSPECYGLADDPLTEVSAFPFLYPRLAARSNDPPTDVRLDLSHNLSASCVQGRLADSCRRCAGPSRVRVTNLPRRRVRRTAVDCAGAAGLVGVTNTIPARRLKLPALAGDHSWRTLIDRAVWEVRTPIVIRTIVTGTNAKSRTDRKRPGKRQGS